MDQPAAARPVVPPSEIHYYNEAVIYSNSVTGDGKARSSLSEGLHCLDVFSMNGSRTTANGYSMTYNIGTKITASVNVLVEKLSNLQRFAHPPIYAPARTGEIKRSVLNASLAHKELDWRSTHSLEQGLKKTWQYFEQTATKEAVIR